MLTKVNHNRLGLVTNSLQSSRKRVLCVCSAGLLRSPTAAWILGNEPFGFNTRACGAAVDYALVPLDPAMVLWAREIVVMDEEQAAYARACQQWLNEQQMEDVPARAIHVLNIPDNYKFRDPELIEIMTPKLEKLFLGRVSE